MPFFNPQRPAPHAREDVPTRRYRAAHQSRPGTRRTPSRGGRPDRAGAEPYSIVIPPPNVDGLAPYGACAQQHAAGRARALRAHAGARRAVAAGYGPRGHRDADGCRAAAHGAPAAGAARAWARGVRAPRVDVEGRERFDDLQPAPPAWRILRLVARAVHDGRKRRAGRPDGARRHQGVRRSL